MKLRFNPSFLRRTLRWAQRILFAGALLMLAYCGFVVTDTWVFQNAERSQLERLLAARVVPVAMMRTEPVVVKGLVGRIEIARIGLSAIIMEGDDRAILRHAAGHIPGTALPGQPGNAGISAHRDTLFRPLRNLHLNDTITIATISGEYRYRVVSALVVGPDDVGVLRPSEQEVLTLVTCYPFYFVGPAPYRFVVRAERIS